MSKSKLILEGLEDIEQRISTGVVVRKEEFLQVCVLLKDMLQAVTTPEVTPLDGIEREALTQEIADKRKENVSLRKEVSALTETIINWKSQNDQLLEKIGASPDLKLLHHLIILEDNFKKKFDEALILRTEGKLTEFTLTSLTLAYHLVFSAKTAWQMALKEAEKYLEPEPVKPEITEEVVNLTIVPNETGGENVGSSEAGAV